MIPEASFKTAMVVGAWTSFGLSLVEAWTSHHAIESELLRNGVWFAAFALFFWIPAYLFVIGRDNPRFDPLWIADPEQRRAYGVVVKRMFVWFVSAGASGAIWSTVWGFLISD